jgi:galactokinase
VTAPVEWLPAPDDEVAAPECRAAFTDRFGGPPEGVWAAPGRVNLIGEHTDYNRGLCLPMALPHRTYAAVRRRPDDVVRVVSLQQDESWEGNLSDVGPGHPKGWAAYAAGVLWALARRGVAVPGLDILVDGRVPLGSGLSSSAALECAVAVAVADLAGDPVERSADAAHDAGPLSRRELAEACVEAENEVAGANTGGMDQSISLCGRPGHAMLLDCADFSTEHVPWGIGADGWALLVIDTRTQHALVDGQYADRRRTCEESARALGLQSLRELSADELPAALDRLDETARRRVCHVVTENERVREATAVLRAGDVGELGRLFAASHASLRDDYEVSCDELDVAVEAATAAGSPGARMTGGGFGGSAIALVRADDAAAVAQAVADAFDERGWPAPAFLEASPAGPASRLR